MSLAIAFGRDTYGIIVADRGASTEEYAWDLGAPKLVRCGNGFAIAGGGDATACSAFLAAAQRAAVFDLDHLTRLAAQTLSLFPAPDPELPMAVLTLSDAGRVARLDQTGRGDHKIGSIVVGPPESPVGTRAPSLARRLAAPIAGMQELVRIMATFVAEMHEADPRIGAVVDIAYSADGLGVGYLTGNAREIALEDDDAIDVRVASIPAFFLKLADAAVPAHAVEWAHV